MTDEDDDMTVFSDKRQKRVKITAWVVIGALVLTGGGATVISLILRRSPREPREPRVSVAALRVACGFRPDAQRGVGGPS